MPSPVVPEAVWLGVWGGVPEVGLTEGGGGVSLELSLGIRDRSESNSSEKALPLCLGIGWRET